MKTIPPKPVNPLKKLLAELYKKAITQPGIPQRLPLKSGLRIDAMIDGLGNFRMQISRQKLYPSDTEWRTVLKNLPFEVKDANFGRFEHNGRCYLQGKWGEHGRPFSVDW